MPIRPWMCGLPWAKRLPPTMMSPGFALEANVGSMPFMVCGESTSGRVSRCMANSSGIRSPSTPMSLPNFQQRPR